MRTPDRTVLTGTTVRLEPLGEEHVDDLLLAARDERIWAHTGPQPRTREAVLAYREQPGRYPYAVVVDGRALGSTSYGDVNLAVEGLEIGWTWYSPAVWQTRVNPECKLLLLGHAFDQLGAQRVTLKTDALNARSRAAIAKLGARYEGTLRHHQQRPDGSVRDSAFFSLLAPEWPAAKATLLDRTSGSTT
ncbi:MAG: GNAT family N-acetyltransferase [Actinobacteria bacterium]|nr:GNAT family N-acetyltransferase [Actinomycetota bacterium]MCA1719780.1 GNAT family N-acetyltransferase [Actinomycetota bacterium]